MIPTSILVLGISLVYGHAYGPTKGFFVALPLILISAGMGALIAFTAGRYLLKSYIRKYVLKKVKMFEAIDLAIEHHGLKMAAILRLTPLIPHNLYPYVLSVTSLSYRDLVLGHTIGMLPMTGISVYFAVHFKSIEDIMNGPDFGPYSQVYMVTFGVVMILIILLVISYTMEELARMVAKDKAKKELLLQDLQTDQEGEVRDVNNNLSPVGPK